MSPQKLSRISQHMSTASLFIIIFMLGFNSLFWIFPSLLSDSGGYGLTAQMMGLTNFEMLPWWKITGGIILSGIPLVSLSYGLYQLRVLFHTYSKGDYFSTNAARLLGSVGKSIIIWIILNILCEPLLSYWLTFQEPIGNRVIFVSIDFQYIAAVFFAFCVILISEILKKASIINAENQQII